MDQALEERISLNDPVPLSWAGASMEMDYLNVGDALSPVMVALLSGRQVRRVPMKSTSPRMAAVGTIGQSFGGGEVWFWGTGCSNWRNPLARPNERLPFEVPPDSRFVVAATRGPISERLLTGASGHKPGVYGDPVWLLPQFYRPAVKKKWKIGVILHLSELDGRSSVARPRPEMRRFDIPAELADEVHLISTCTPISIQGIGDKIDEILGCERIVSTSLHGMVIAESYGIPCLYFDPNGKAAGPERKPLDPDSRLDLRIADLYAGLGQSKLMTYVQPRDALTDWQAVMTALDRLWQPVTCDTHRLINAFPLPRNPVAPEKGQTIWQHPILSSLRLQHDVTSLRREESSAKAPHTAPVVLRRQPRLGAQGKEELLSRLVAERGSVPLSWVATNRSSPYANLGDALSAVVVAALAGVEVRHAHFDSPIERLVAVGTIGHAQRNGKPHVWGTGFDARPPGMSHYVAPPNTAFEIHATRGPRSAALLRSAGIASAPLAYGDPIWLLPRIWPMEQVRKSHDIGVVVHISELDLQHPESGVRPAFRRYAIPHELTNNIRIINTLVPPSLEGLKAKVAEIAACRAILSTSLHGLVLAEAYGIPCAWFGLKGAGAGRMLPLADDDVSIDHRMRDFYLGADASHLPAFCLDRDHGTDWTAANDFIKANWSPLSCDAADLIEAFPLPLAASDPRGIWTLTPSAAEGLRF
jgi:polysaccharide pyruvyl transferase WcaK-like protein